MTLEPGTGHAVAWRPAARTLQSAAAPALWVPEQGGTRLPDVEAALVAITNAHRRSIGVAELSYDTGGGLDYCANWKSEDMAANMYLAHDQTVGPKAGTTWVERFIACGVNQAAAFGENASYGLQSGQAIFDAFMSDVGHRSNLENASWRATGVAVVRASNGLDFCTQDFANVRSPLGPPEPPVPPPPTSGDPIVGEEWRKKAAHRFVVDIDGVAKAGAGRRVYAHHPGGLPSSLDWTLSTFKRNFERVPGSRVSPGGGTKQ
jgi:uncharacterized protein YkwD